MVIGMWLVLLPGLIGAFQWLAIPVESPTRTRILVGLAFYLYGSVLYTITRRYLDAKRA